MARVSKYGKSHAVRFLKAIDKELITYCINNEINESDVLQQSVECYLRNPKCLARRRIK